MKNVLEKILEEIKQYTEDVYECDLDDIVEYQRRNREDKCTYIVQGIEEATEFIRSHMDEAKDANVHGNDDYVMFTINEDGVAEDYDDTYDVTIHCESENEQKRVIGMLERYQGWIPVEEQLPEDCEEIVLAQVSGKVTENIWFDNAFELATYVNGEGWILENYPEWKNPKVIAWQPLPEQYQPKEQNNGK